MSNVNDYLTWIGNEEDEEYLTTKLLDVNIRLLKANRSYSGLVERACVLISNCALAKMDGYSLPYGMSGANVGVPWNIIAIVKNRGTDEAYADILINPKITRRSNRMVQAKTNCGSVRLDKSIEVWRHEEVTVHWYDLAGNPHEKHFSRAEGSLTLQHEIEHNLGILITDHKT